MPKEMTHWLIAGKALNRLDPASSIHRILSRHRDLYFVGAVLPDTPAHLITGRHKELVRTLDLEFHDPAESSLAPAAHFIAGQESPLKPEYLALLAGTITHIITDSVFHPFVYYYCGPHDMKKHYRLETYLDIYFIRKNNENLKSLKKILKSGDADTKTILSFMSLYFDRNSRLKPGVYKKILRLHGLIQSAWLKPALLKTSKGISLIPGVKIDDKLELFYPPVHRGDIFNGAYSFINPVTGEHKRASVDELALEAVEKISSLLKKLDSMNGNDEMADLLFSTEGPNPLTGLQGKTFAEMKFFSDIKNIDEVIFR